MLTPGLQESGISDTGLDTAETEVATSPLLELVPLIRLELFGYKASFCAFLLLRKPRFMTVDGIGVVPM